MINIDSRNNQISIIQGDTGVIDFVIDNYQLSEGDVVYFTVVDKDLPKGSEPVIKKKITEFNDGAAAINLLALDTQELEPKKYFYDIQVNTKDGRVDTVIAPSKFVVMEGISHEW